MQLLDDDLADYFWHMAEQILDRSLEDGECEQLMGMLAATAYSTLPPKVMAARTKCVSTILCFTPDDSPLVTRALNLIDPIIEDKDLH